MIVLDEQLKNTGLAEQIASWYPGRVIPVTSLRPGTVIKDDAIAMLLRRVQEPTFVTINVSDFWRRIPADSRYCVACFPMPDERVHEVPELLRRLFRTPEFETRQSRLGKIALVSVTQAQYYQVGDAQVYTLLWPTP